MFLMDWKLTLVVLASFPGVLLALYLVIRKLRRSVRRQRKKEGQLASRINDMLGTVAVSQAFGREQDQLRRFDAESAQSMDEGIKTARIQAAGARLAEIVAAAGTCIVVLFGGMQVMAGSLSPGMLLVFSAYVVGLYRPVKAMARLSARAARAAAAIERLSEILDIQPDIEDDPSAIEARGLRGEIAFENVSFAYEPGKPVLSNVSFRIPAGKRVALVGASGAGKSTIAGLILRLYDPAEGRVCIDGVDLRRYRRTSLRQQIAVVLQENMLLRASVHDNIAYGRPEATRQEVEQAAREAQAHDFIMRLPRKYDEVIGERGCTLSGGERQRIALARALVKRSPVLIVDEPTSAVGADAETLIRKRIFELRPDATLLVIAHELRSVQDADWILVLQDGRIVEHGPHAELVRRKGHYCELFRLRVFA
jgi:ATP-binding cassette subfamily B protein/subfamily B ATP-binding cassette protein MsbA